MPQGESMSQDEHNEWVKSLKTGDRVGVIAGYRVDLSARIIFTATVRRTPKHIYLDDGKVSWATGFRNDAGAGPRCIIPVSS